MIVDWTKHLNDPLQKKEMESTVRNSTVLIERLKDLLSEYEEELTINEIKMDAYNNPSWAYKQAHINGRRQELQRLKKLITL